MKIVANATPIIALSRIRKLDLLQKIYGKVFVAQEVFAETVEFARGKPDVDSIESSSYYLSGNTMNSLRPDNFSHFLLRLHSVYDNSDFDVSVGGISLRNFFPLLEF